VQTLVARGADVNAKDNVGKTALTAASQKGHNEVVRRHPTRRARKNSLARRLHPSGAVVAITLQAADFSDNTTIGVTLQQAQANAALINERGVEELVADKGYHSNEVLVPEKRATSELVF